MTVDTCGVAAHSEECLCDVVVDDVCDIVPLDPKTTWGLSFALNAGHHLEDPEAILNLLEALALAKDAAVNMVHFDPRRGEVRATEKLRLRLKEWIEQGESLIDAPAQFRVSWGEILASLTQGQPSSMWAWSESMWAEIEDFIFAHDDWCGYRALMRRFDITRANAQSLEKLYREAVRRVPASTRAAMIAAILRSPVQKSHKIANMIGRDGHTVTADDVNRARHHLRKRGLLPVRDRQTISEWRSSSTRRSNPTEP
ncbi:MAG: hypothetical protein ACO3O7_05695 [Ilumatobacteraceae bacterium]